MIKLILVGVLYALQAFAGFGQDGGGGSRLESAFRLTAFELIHQVSKNSAANKICPAEAMLAGLNQSKIEVVDSLIDLNTGRPILDQYLDAWTRPGDLQLKRTAWIKYLNNDQHLDSSINALILHEVYRTTSLCNDDKGNLSTQVAQLLKQKPPADPSAIFSKNYSFKYPVSGLVRFYKNPNDENDTLMPGGVACEQPFNLKQPVAGIKCIFAGQDATSVVSIMTTTSNPKWPLTTLVRVIVSWQTGGNWNKVMSLARLATVAQPLYAVYDLQTGSLAYGVDLSSLINLN